MAHRPSLQRWLLAPLIVALAIGGNLLSECCALVELCREAESAAAPACCSVHRAEAATAAGASCHGFRPVLHGSHPAPADSCGCRAHEDPCTADLGGPPLLVARDPIPADWLALPAGFVLLAGSGGPLLREVAPPVSPGDRPLYRRIARIRC